MKRLFAFLLALCLLPAVALAEVSFTDVYPLVNMTATAVMLTGEGISPEQSMSEELARCLLAVGLVQEMGYTSFDMNNVAWRDGYLASAYAAPHADVTGDVAQPENYAYYGVRPMVIDESDDGSAVRILGDVYQADDYLEALDSEQYARVQWLDQRAVVELRRHEGAPGGWQLYSFALDAEWEMEQATQDYFTSTMAEYINAEWGLSIQYPAVFGEESITMDENGISGTLPQASFSVMRSPNDHAWTTETLLHEKKQETPGAETNINDITGCGRLHVQAEGMVQVTFLLVTEDYVYQAQLNYQQDAAKDFALYCDYMMNSFTLDELGVG